MARPRKQKRSPTPSSSSPSPSPVLSSPSPPPIKRKRRNMTYIVESDDEDVQDKRRKDGKDGKDEKDEEPEDERIDENDLKILSANCVTLEELINIGMTFKKYLFKTPEQLGINEHRFLALFKVSNMVDELTEINNMIGLKDIKAQIVSQIAYLLAGFKEDFFMNTVICGGPGMGKTQLSKLIGKAYFKSGILSNAVFISATRSNLIGKYLGETALNTTRIFNSAKGGVLFIDEAYALGNENMGNGDIYSKECIDTLNHLIGENKNTMVIVAGYLTEMERCFFSVNRGLHSRFPWRFEIVKYTEGELHQMFIARLKIGDWTLPEKDSVITEKFFKKHSMCFENAGRDVDNFFIKCCMIHANQNFLDNSNKVITNQDALESIKIITNAINQTKEQNKPPEGMYI